MVMMMGALAQAQGLLERMKQKAALREGVVELAYGKEDLQKLDYWKPKDAGSPLVVFVHGGGWKRGDKAHAADTKAAHYLSQGYGFVSMNYRLVPAVKVEEQAADVAMAVAYLVKEAKTLGFDARRIVLMGHSAGAHLVALVGTDPQYLQKAGMGMNAVSGIIPLDGACYDVPKQMAHGSALMDDTYVQAFGEEKKRQSALSPTHHAATPNAPAFLILHVQRIDGAEQSKALGEALKKAGTPAEVKGFEGIGMKGHMEINRRLGEPDYAATPVVDEWLKKVLQSVPLKKGETRAQKK
jgi:acetyl esterase/lipase